MAETDVAEVPRCPVCAGPVGGSDELPVLGCPRCGTPHHADCWEYHGGCAVYGCREQAPPEAVEVAAWPVALRDYRSWLRLVGQTRRATVVFAVSCMVVAHLAVLGLAWAESASLLVLLAPLLPLLLSVLSFVLLERRGLELRRRLEPLTGGSPFDEAVSARQSARWLAGARSDLGAGGSGFVRIYGPPALVALLLLVPTAALAGAGELVFLALFDLFILYLARDSFVGMRQEQAILIARFAATFSPNRRVAGGKGKGEGKDGTPAPEPD